jgi:hypothetical protein
MAVSVLWGFGVIVGLRLPIVDSLPDVVDLQIRTCMGIPADKKVGTRALPHALA